MDKKELNKLTLAGKGGLHEMADKLGIDTTLNKAPLIDEIVKAQKKKGKLPKKSGKAGEPVQEPLDLIGEKAALRLDASALGAFAEDLKNETEMAIKRLQAVETNALRISESAVVAEVPADNREKVADCKKSVEKVLKALGNI